MNENMPVDPFPPVVDLRPLMRGETLDAESEAVLRRIAETGVTESVIMVGKG